MNSIIKIDILLYFNIYIYLVAQLNKLRVREHPINGPYVEGLTIIPVTNYEEVSKNDIH